jgi:hypothetical protein
MSPRHLKSLIQAGHYRPDPALVAEAMLARHGVRQLLIEVGTPSEADRSRSARAAARRVA